MKNSDNPTGNTNPTKSDDDKGAMPDYSRMSSLSGNFPQKPLTSVDPMAFFVANKYFAANSNIIKIKDFSVLPGVTDVTLPKSDSYIKTYGYSHVKNDLIYSTVLSSSATSSIRNIKGDAIKREITFKILRDIIAGTSGNRGKITAKKRDALYAIETEKVNYLRAKKEYIDPSLSVFDHVRKSVIAENTVVNSGIRGPSNRLWTKASSGKIDRGDSNCRTVVENIAILRGKKQSLISKADKDKKNSLTSVPSLEDVAEVKDLFIKNGPEWFNEYTKDSPVRKSMTRLLNGYSVSNIDAFLYHVADILFDKDASQKISAIKKWKDKVSIEYNKVRKKEDFAVIDKVRLAIGTFETLNKKIDKSKGKNNVERISNYVKNTNPASAKALEDQRMFIKRWIKDIKKDADDILAINLDTLSSQIIGVRNKAASKIAVVEARFEMLDSFNMTCSGTVSKKISRDTAIRLGGDFLDDFEILTNIVNIVKNDDTLKKGQAFIRLKEKFDILDGQVSGVKAAIDSLNAVNGSNPDTVQERKNNISYIEHIVQNAHVSHYINAALRIDKKHRAAMVNAEDVGVENSNQKLSNDVAVKSKINEVDKPVKITVEKKAIEKQEKLDKAVGKLRNIKSLFDKQYVKSLKKLGETYTNSKLSPVITEHGDLCSVMTDEYVKAIHVDDVEPVTDKVNTMLAKYSRAFSYVEDMYDKNDKRKEELVASVNGLFGNFRFQINQIIVNSASERQDSLPEELIKSLDSRYKAILGGDQSMLFSALKKHKYSEDDVKKRGELPIIYDFLNEFLKDAIHIGTIVKDFTEKNPALGDETDMVQGYVVRLEELNERAKRGSSTERPITPVEEPSLESQKTPRPSTSRAFTPRPSTPERASTPSTPRPLTPVEELVTPRPSTPRPLTPSTPRPLTPVEELVTPRPSTPRPSTPRPSTSRASTPRPSTPERASTPSTPRPLTPSTPRPSTPRPSTSRPSTSRASTPRPLTPVEELVTPRPSTPRPSTPRPSTPRPLTPSTPRPLTPVEELVTPRPSTPSTPRDLTSVEELVTPRPYTPSTPERPSTPRPLTPSTPRDLTSVEELVTPRPLTPSTPERPSTPRPLTPVEELVTSTPSTPRPLTPVEELVTSTPSTPRPYTPFTPERASTPRPLTPVEELVTSTPSTPRPSTPSTPRPLTPVEELVTST
ncbi:MAG: hypothetical protein JJW01_03175, partial [Alphaproteobacteria bacterium]|nr:hypothetical protein [Rickettsiales bacterium]